MLTQEVDKGAYTRTYRPVAVIHRTKRHLNGQTLICHQFYEFAARNFLINHIVRQTGDAVSLQTKLFQRLTAIRR
ncbi:Uncharacterised protein [Enterobacter cancerogenus]|uniref:Uncharacterized protein n=1 Tax=Enterobacter cancerogenus TaxID=69218 RepID=A0A484WTD3_9ENTR|nr:Uncharacterised protein [Enterobacter cancerogenus]